MRLTFNFVNVYMNLVNVY